MKKSQLIIDKAKLFDAIYKPIAEEQTRRLIEYAKEKIKEIGEYIQTYNSKNHMDATGNLLDSLCWGVSYDGSLVEGGFYRSKTAREASWLHGWSYVKWNEGKYGKGENTAGEPIDGHELAASYIQSYGNNGGKGWKVFFAILAPYWGYWEKGFTLHHGFSSKRGKNGEIKYIGASFQQFAVMTQFYDVVRKDLKPARTRFRVSVNKYASKSLYRQAKRNEYGR